ncbi:glycosyltransferase family 2 protein [Bradyrhizobium cosmicum]|uniref:glycosyltransferase family 2 protein n=1 Tax=Bradyrhizobium cosmicum TaxID=1404864 RepID=UPI001161E7C1|nr:glycosyltransferase family 2 protein [Bradyrhizobium cosmicum]QDP24380.1 glycosyltransferase family 2 protein [Bradyrhizobium cosmicum]
MAGVDSTPLASIVIPAYNAADCIQRALKSIDDQSEKNLEIIVVDDCSTDETVSIVERAAQLDVRIRLITSPQNGGPSTARNLGFSAARGEWILILDADDAYRGDRVSTLIRLATEHKLDMICDNIVYHDIRAGKDVRPATVPFETELTPLTLELFLKNSLYLPPIFSRSRRQLTQFALLKFCFRRSFVEQANLRYDKEYRDNEDFIFYSECLIAGARAAFYNSPMYVYTQGFGEISRENSDLARTPRDRSLIVKAVNELILRRGNSLKPGELRLLHRRAREAQGMQAFERAMGELRKRHFMGATRSLLSKRTAVQFFTNELIVLAARRLRGR